MNTKTYFRISGLLIIVILFFVPCYLLLFISNNKIASSKASLTEVNTAFKSFDHSKQTLSNLVNDHWKDPRGIFPIIGYNLPEKTNDLVGALKVIEKGGINIIINGNLGWMPEPYKIKSAFKELQNSNLKWLAIIENECKDNFIFRNTNDKININIKRYLSEFNDDFIYGWYVWDEPGLNKKLCSIFPESNNDFEDVNTITNQIRSDSLFSDKLDFVNLYPTYWLGFNSSKDYENYIDEFFASQEFKPRVLCADHYPLLKDEFGGFRNDYYLNLEILRKKSQEYNVPLWMIILTSEHESYKKISFEEISLQVFSALAYGAKGIMYYLYSKSWEHVTYNSWILEDYVDNPNVADSLHGPLFAPVQKLNENIQTLGKILTNLKSVEVIHTSDYPNKQKEITQSLFKNNQSDKLIKEILRNGEANTDSKLLIGVYEVINSTSSEDNFLLVVNKDVASSSKIVVTLNKEYRTFKFDKETGEKKLINTNDSISSTISAGSGELFYLE